MPTHHVTVLLCAFSHAHYAHGWAIRQASHSSTSQDKSQTV